MSAGRMETDRKEEEEEEADWHCTEREEGRSDGGREERADTECTVDGGCKDENWEGGRRSKVTPIFYPLVLRVTTVCEGT